MKVFVSVITLFIVTCSSYIATAQMRRAVDTPVTKPVIIGRCVTIRSDILGEDVQLYISTPAGYDGGTQKYPVVYVLDGKYYFPYLTTAVEVLSGNSKMPECIVVGIASNNRFRDYSPAPVKGFQQPGPMTSSGGADAYLEYIENEVQPFINTHYRTQPYNILIGHSLGGLLVAYAMVQKPGLFQAYINIDGSLWYNNGANGDSLISYFKQHPGYKGNYTFVLEKMPQQVWFPITHRMHDYFAEEKPAGLNYNFIEIDNESHATLIYPGAYYALRDLYANFEFRFNPHVTLTDIQRHYDSLSGVYNYKVDIPEDMYEEDMYHCRDILNDTGKAVVTCSAWIQTYPNSARAYTASGELYAGMGNPKEATNCYKKALEIKPGYQPALEGLKKLQGH